MEIILRQIKESFNYAISSLIVNKLRTFLSLLGITIGIFVIISIFAVIDSLESYISKNLGTLGSDVIYIQKWPWVAGGGKDYPWWKYINRPVTTYKEYVALKKSLKNAKYTAFVASTAADIKYKSHSLENVPVTIASYEYNLINEYKIDKGRYFTENECLHGKPIAIIGSNMAEELFGNINPLYKTIKIKGLKYKIIGVFAKQGLNMGFNTDNTILVPVNSAYKLTDINKEPANPFIMVKAKPGAGIKKLKTELRYKLRKIRKLPPSADDNFALNQLSLITDGIKQFFKTLNFAGMLIGMFSILIGGFGIANIMFVSVKERTKIIGIQKALGAKNYFILLQFLFESSILAAIGGLIGLILIFAGFAILNKVIDQFEFTLSMLNIIEGLGISVIIGIIAGSLPAKSAASLRPVEAMNSVF